MKGLQEICFVESAVAQQNRTFPPQAPYSSQMADLYTGEPWTLLSHSTWQDTPDELELRRCAGLQRKHPSYSMLHYDLTPLQLILH